ncbi:hypothetical protein Tco_1248111 [Tanacetum coccineum]
MRLKTNIKLKEATFQVVLDALALTPFYQAFLITVEVIAIYKQEFWATVSIHKDLGHTGDITYLTDVNVDYLHQPWRAFATVINKCLSGKETGMDKIHLEDEVIPSGEQSSPLVPKTVKQLAARRNQERIKSILLFRQYSHFQLEIHGAYVSKEDINQKFLRSLPPSWSQIALIMRNKPDIDEIDIDDLYNNLRVYEDEMKKSSTSSSNTQNLAFLSSENTNSTNEVSTASGDFGVSTAGGINQVPSTPSAHDIAYSFLAQPTTSPQLENEDFQQMDGDDLEELDLRWQVAMLTGQSKGSSS